MADARTSGTAVTRIFSIIQAHDRNEDAAFAYIKSCARTCRSTPRAAAADGYRKLALA